MNDLTKYQRDRVHFRDGDRCLACGHRPATIQHRRAKGMGGRGEKAEPLTCADAVLLCMTCNREAEASMQSEALRFGWKIPRNCPIPAVDIPFFDRMTATWWKADEVGDRDYVDPGWAQATVQRALAA